MLRSGAIPPGLASVPNPKLKKEMPMKPAVSCLRFLACLTMLPSALAFSQTTAATVYVSQSSTPNGPGQVYAFAVAPNGKLTPTAGSPYPADVTLMVDNGKYLVGASTDNQYLNTYTIEPDGALKFAVANDIGRLTNGFDTSGFSDYLDLDHTGATLYDLRFNANDDNFYLETFILEKATGALKLVPDTHQLSGLGNNLTDPSLFTISANDKYIYGVDSGRYGFDFYMFNRGPNGGLLMPAADAQPIDKPKDKFNYGYDPIGISADPLNHVAVAFANDELEEGPEQGPNRLGVYTAAADGKLTTSSTMENMPKVAVGNVSLKMAPSGKLLAAIGTTGLQVFHFNGSEPITNEAVLVRGVSFAQAYWDDNDHLFAVSQTSGKLYVFTVTPTHVAAAPGSPYSIPGAQNLILRIKKVEAK